MPYTSDAQRKYFNFAKSQGMIKPSIVKDYNTASKGMNLPDYAPKIPKIKYKSVNYNSKMRDYLTANPNIKSGE